MQALPALFEALLEANPRAEGLPLRKAGLQISRMEGEEGEVAVWLGVDWAAEGCAG